MTSNSSPVSSLRWWLLAIALPLVLLFLHKVSQGFVVDDAYIVFRYVAHLSIGHGLVYNPGEYVEGFSCPSWVFLLSFFHMMGLTVEWFAPILGLVCTVAAAMVTGLFVHQRLNLSFAYVALATLLVVSSWPLVFWSGAGLETSLFVLLLAITAMWMTAKLPLAESQGILCALVAFFLAVTRPEGTMFAGAAMTYAAWKHYRDKGRISHIVLAGLSFLAMLSTGLAARWLYYSDLLPNTYYTKVGSGLSSIPRGFTYLWGFVSRGMGGLLLLLALGGVFIALQTTVKKLSFPPHPLLAPALLSGCGLFFILVVGGDGLYSYRFVAHIIPALAILAAGTAATLEQQHKGLGLTLLLAACILGAIPAKATSLLPGVKTSHLRKSEDRWIAVGKAFNAIVPPQTKLATNIAGKLPYYSRIYTIDLLGLTNKEIAKVPIRSMGHGYAGHEKFKTSVIFEHQPDLLYLSVLDPCPPNLFVQWQKIHDLLKRTPLRGYASLFTNPNFRKLYAPAFLLLKSGAFASFYIKRSFAQMLGKAHPRIRNFSWKGQRTHKTPHRKTSELPTQPLPTTQPIPQPLPTTQPIPQPLPTTQPIPQPLPTTQPIP